MTVIQVDAGGLADLAQRAEQAADAVDQAVKDGLRVAGEMVADNIRTIAPRRTGRLVESTEVIMEGDQTRITVAATRDGYAYPKKVDRTEHFMQRALDAARNEITDTIGQNVDDAVRGAL